MTSLIDPHCSIVGAWVNHKSSNDDALGYRLLGSWWMKLYRLLRSDHISVVSSHVETKQHISWTWLLIQLWSRFGWWDPSSTETSGRLCFTESVWSRLCRSSSSWSDTVRKCHVLLWCCFIFHWAGFTVGTTFKSWGYTQCWMRGALDTDAHGRSLFWASSQAVISNHLLVQSCINSVAELTAGLSTLQ